MSTTAAKATPAAAVPWPQPEIDALNQPYWDGLAAGHLSFQQCGRGHRWLPARHHCPHCLSSDMSWQRASGAGRLVSWVVYRTAFHPAFKARLPYNVAIVELDEGPRLITNILAAPDELRADARVQLVAQRPEGAGDEVPPVAQFRQMPDQPAR